MADVSENLEDEELQSLKFLLSSTLPKERLARATVRQETVHFKPLEYLYKKTEMNINVHIARSKVQNLPLFHV